MNVCIIGGGGQIAESIGYLLRQRKINTTYYRPRRVIIYGVPKRPGKSRSRLYDLLISAQAKDVEDMTFRYSWASEQDLKKTDVFIFTLPSYLAEYIGFELAPYLSEKIVINVSDRFLGTYALAHTVRMRLYKPIKLGIALNSPPFLAYQLYRNSETNVYYQKPYVVSSCFPKTEKGVIQRIVSSVFGFKSENIKVLPSIIDLAFENINSIVHVVQDLENLKRGKYRKVENIYNEELYTPDMVKRIIQITNDRDSVAKHFTKKPFMGLALFDQSTFFHKSITSQISGGTAIYRHNHPLLQRIPTPQWYAAHGFEDVGWSMVSVESFGQAIGIRTPHISAVINEWNRFMDVDYRKVGRTAKSLGLHNSIPLEMQKFPRLWSWDEEILYDW